MVTDGLRWAPEMWPVESMTIITARPPEAARPSIVSDPCVFWLTMPVAAPAKDEDECAYEFCSHLIQPTA